MKELFNLLVAELEEFGKRTELSKSSLEMVDTLAHAAKNIAKIMDYCNRDMPKSTVKEIPKIIKEDELKEVLLKLVDKM